MPTDGVFWNAIPSHYFWWRLQACGRGPSFKIMIFFRFVALIPVSISSTTEELFNKVNDVAIIPLEYAGDESSNP
jgi:hypothetical protein